MYIGPVGSQWGGQEGDAENTAENPSFSVCTPEGNEIISLLLTGD